MNKKYHIYYLQTSIIAFFVLLILIITPHTVLSQEQKADLRYMHNETVDDEYVPMLAKDKKTSPAYRSRSSNFYTIQVNVDDNGDNILGDAGNEPSIAVDPANPENIVIGWRQFDHVSSNFRQAGYSYSTDGGLSWTFPEPIEAGIFRSDPVLDFDNEGNFYYNSLTKDASSNYWCDVFKSENGGAEWDEGTYAFGGDKQWMKIDKTNGIGDGNIYEFWNSSYSSCFPGSYTRSTNGGDDYDDCDGIPGDPYWGTIAVGPDGEMYLVGAPGGPGLVVAKSITAQDPGSQTTWETPSYVDMDGNLSGWRPVNPAGLLGQSYIDVDVSDGPGRGNVYVLAAVMRDNDDPGDIMFARSTDGGVTWDDAVQVNDDFSPSVCQWFGTMSVAPNGRIDAVWLDTRNAPGVNEFMSELYYSYSIDQGVTWSQNEKLSDAFDPHLGWPNQQKMGDYFHMVSGNDGAHLAWANTLNGEQDVYYGFINPWFVGVDEKQDNRLSFINYPNPVSSTTTFRYFLNEEGTTKVAVYDVCGNLVDVVLHENQKTGTHNIVYDASSLPAGVYYCELTLGKVTETIKLIRIE